MFRFMIITIPLLVGACSPLNIYHQTGVSVTQLRTDETSCDVRALRDAPVANQIRRTPARYIPPRQFCDSDGNCYSRGGFWEPGEIYTVDVNQDLRRRVKDQCMMGKGYRAVSIPPCPQAVADAAPSAVTGTLPRLTETSCVIRNRDRSWQIVNQG
ncbi:hypothetical protein CFI11_10980 [Thalassococcus sp. S3]|nr:hypothetical protein CFI11_10980 [Thalassococcus sp. S3]